MEETIKLNYNLNFKSITNEKSICIAKDEKNTYYFVPYERPEADLKDLFELTDGLIKKNVACHTFVLNRNNKILVNVNNQNYLLMQINFSENHEFNLNDIINMNKLTALANSKSTLYRNDWAKLWSEKVDYFEYQMQEIGADKKIVLNSLSYYIGLAENAISYVNYVQSISQNNNNKIVLSHKRIFSPNYAINYLNPLNFVFDLEVRDIAEYIKYSFFNDNDIWPEIDEMFKIVKFTSYEAHMFYARLLYPSYYFDIYEYIMNKDKSEEELIPIIKKCDEYENFLAEMYHYLNNFTSMLSVDWLIKKGVKTQQE